MLQRRKMLIHLVCPTNPPLNDCKCLLSTYQFHCKKAAQLFLCCLFLDIRPSRYVWKLNENRRLLHSNTQFGTVYREIWKAERLGGGWYVCYRLKCQHRLLWTSMFAIFPHSYVTYVLLTSYAPHRGPCVNYDKLSLSENTLSLFWVISFMRMMILFGNWEVEN